MCYLFCLREYKIIANTETKIKRKKNSWWIFFKDSICRTKSLLCLFVRKFVLTLKKKVKKPLWNVFYWIRLTFLIYTVFDKPSETMFAVFKSTKLKSTCVYLWGDSPNEQESKRRKSPNTLQWREQVPSELTIHSSARNLIFLFLFSSKWKTVKV